MIILTSAPKSWQLNLNEATFGSQREYGLKPLKHSIVERILAFKR